MWVLLVKLFCLCTKLRGSGKHDYQESISFKNNYKESKDSLVIWSARIIVPNMSLSDLECHMMYTLQVSKDAQYVKNGLTGLG